MVCCNSVYMYIVCVCVCVMVCCNSDSVFLSGTGIFSEDEMDDKNQEKVAVLNGSDFIPKEVRILIIDMYILYTRPLSNLSREFV